MVKEYEMISAMRDVISVNKEIHKHNFTEVGKKRYDLAKKQFDLEKKIKENITGMKKLYNLIKKYDFSNKSYTSKFIEMEEKTLEMYFRLKELGYEKKYKALFCPLFDTEEYLDDWDSIE